MNFGKKRNAFWLLILLFGLNVYSVYSASVKQLCQSDRGKISYENAPENDDNYFLRSSENENTASRLQEQFSSNATTHTSFAIGKSLKAPISFKDHQLELTHYFYIRYSRLLI